MPASDAPRVLFLSRGDSSRSQIAEGFLRIAGSNGLIPVSAGTDSPKANPLAIEAMAELGIDISGQEAEEVRKLFFDKFRYVVAMCDSTKERFPVFPFSPNILRRSIVDPAAISGGDDIRRQIFRRVRDQIKKSVDDLIVSTAN